MTEDDDLDGLAAEYVLGSLNLAERREVGARRRQDAGLDRAVAAWERRLGLLSAAERGIEPPPDLFAKIADRLWGTERASGTVIQMPARQRLGGVRAFAGIGALAACLLLAVGWLLLNRPGSPTRFVAELYRSAGAAADEGAGPKGAPAVRATLDLKAHSMTVDPISLRATPRRNFELWLLRSGGAEPLSLGLISHATPTKVPWREDYPTSGLADDTLAVSLEPEGGSPAGKPTGPILFVGKLAPPAGR